MATNNQINTPEPFSLSSGGTGASLSIVQGGVVYGTSSSMSFSAVGISGQFLQSQGTSEPVFATVSGTLVGWTTITGATLAAAINNGYIINDTSAQCVITLPATAAIGSKISIRGLSTGSGWVATANTGQTIQFGNQSSSSAGSWGTTIPTDGCDLECIVANTTWTLSNCVSAGLTKV